jgi:DNA polymerase-4
VMESFSIDEVFLDMTGTSLIYPDPIQTAHEIKDKIKNELGFTVNVGISTNKLLAKMASDFEKPDKVHTLLKEEIKEKLWPLDVGDLFMVGKRTKEELNELNIYTIKDLAFASDTILERKFKNQAKHLKEAALGIDNSKVEPRSNKTTSISTTETLAHDYTEEEKLKEVLFRQTEDVTRELRKQKQYATTVAVIYKNSDFRSYSAQSKLKNPTNSTKEIYKLVLEIFDKSYKKDPIRLIGVRLADLKEKKEKQMNLFEEETNEEEKEEEIQKTIDDINQKFGKSIVSPASLKVIGTKDTKHNLKN